MTAVFPQAPVDLKAELNLGGTWTVVTSDVLQREDPTPVTFTRGRPDESSQATPSAAQFQLNNRAGNYTVRNPSGAYYGQLNRNTPIRWSVPAAVNYARFEDDAVSSVSAPDNARLDITGDLEVQIDFRLSDWQPALLCSKYATGSHRAWALALNGDGTLFLQYMDNVGTVHVNNSTVPVPAGRVAVKATVDVNNGAGGHTGTFYTAATIAGPWTQLGDPVTGSGTLTLDTNNAALTVGYVSDYTGDNPGAEGLLGAVYGFRVLSGIGGTVEAYADFTAQAAGATTWTDSPGNTWTVNGTAEVSGRDYRFHGEMSALPVSWDTSGNDVWVPAAAGGQLRRLGQGNAPIYSAMKRAVLALSGTLAPVAYWPCEDASGATSIGSAIGGPLMIVSGAADFAADSSFACSDAIPVVNSSAWHGGIPAYTSSGSIIVRFLLDPSTAPAAGTRIMRVICTGTVRQFSMYSGGSAGVYGLAGFDSDGGTVFDTGNVTFTGIGSSPVWVSMEEQPSGGTVNCSLVLLQPGAEVGQAATDSYSGTIGNATACVVNPASSACSIGLGHITVQSDWQSLFDLFNPLFAWTGETAAARVTRLCAENGFASRIIGPPDTSAAMGPQSPDTLSNLLQECETADMGQLFEPRQFLAIGYRTLASLYNQDPGVTLNYSAAMLGGTGTDLAPTYDDQYTRNDITAQRSSGASSGASYRAVLDDGSAMSISPPPAGVGDYSDTADVNLEADSQLPSAAAWLVHLGTVNDYRWPDVPVNMARAAVSSVSAAVQGCDIGDYIVITSPPGQLPPDQIRQIAVQTTEVAGGYHWTISFACVPESPYEVAVVADTVLGRVETDGSSLHSNATSGATSLSADSSGTLWTTAGGDVPFDIAIGGEQITVTAISGSSSPQTFTATRSVNGVVKAHTAGDAITLYRPPVAAL